MLKDLIHIHEHQFCDSLTEEELFSLLKEPNKLINDIDIQKNRFRSGYFIGLTWLANTGKALYITPKLDTCMFQIDYLQMLSESLKHTEILKYSDNLFKIEFDKPKIKITKQQDLITPLIIVYFLQIVHVIVRKGLKKGYYNVDTNLFAKVKGKVLVSQTLKQNIFKNKSLNNVCSYDEFGLNIKENRIIKKALLFVVRYLKLNNQNNNDFSKLLSFILPVFSQITDEIDINEIKSIKKNPFYSEYSKAIDLSKILLKRFGFNINIIEKNEVIEVSPFWINMPLIFELFVLGKLKKALGNKEIIFQSSSNYGEIDFLRKTKDKETIIDTKYKTFYKDRYDIDDIRQLSAYARDKGTLKKLDILPEKWVDTVLDCLIIYPDQTANDYLDEENFKKTSIKQFEKFYKVGISIPEIQMK